MIVMEKIAVVMALVENIAVEYFLDSRNFRSRLVVGVDDTQVVVDKLDRVSFAFQTEDTVARKNLSFVTMSMALSAFGCGGCLWMYSECASGTVEWKTFHPDLYSAIMEWLMIWK
ncbi:hypothetical protein Tco_0969766 [Tanacetum coccineum]